MPCFIINFFVGLFLLSLPHTILRILQAHISKLYLTNAVANTINLLTLLALLFKNFKNYQIFK